MQQFGGINSKRHFMVVMGDKEHGLYVSSTPSSAAKKAVTKLCAKNKSKKVEFHIQEITQGSKKKTYGPYLGYIEKLKKPIELKGRVIKYKPFAKLQKKEGGGFFSTSEFNINKTTGQLTSNAKNKMLENFKQEFSSQEKNIKERMSNTDTFYFGAKNLIEYNRNKYFPFSICNIVHNKEALVLITQKNEKKVDNTLLKLRILIFGSSTNKNLLKELESITKYSQEYPVLNQIITERYSVIYYQDELFIFLEFNLLYYYQIIKWIIYFGENFLIDPNKYFPQSIKLIIDILTNLKGLADFHQLGQFHKLFWNYKYATAMELCLNEIFNESFNFAQMMEKLPLYIRITKQQQQQLQQQLQQQQQQQQLQQEKEQKKEFNRRVSELCNDGYKPVYYQKDSNNCMLQVQDKCIGCKEITMQDKIENFSDSFKKGYNKKVQNLSQDVQAITPRLPTQNQLRSVGYEFLDKAKTVAQTVAFLPLAPISILAGAVNSASKFISNRIPGTKVSDSYVPSPYSWSNKHWLNPTPKGQSR
jgi:hypothetical protein